MTKTNWILLSSVILIVVLGGVGGFFLLNSNKENKNASDSSTNLINLAQESMKATDNKELQADKTYEDIAGFSFGYPKDGKVSDIAEEDENIYSRLKITHKNTEFTLLVEDTKFKKIDDAAPKGAKLAGATKLGDLSANQYELDNVFYTLAIDKGILYSLSGSKDSEELQGLIAKTFLFADQKTTTTSSGGDNTIYEEEEVVE